MKDIIIILIPIITSIISGFVTYFTSRNQFRNELIKVKEQSKNDLDKVKAQCDTEIDKIREQCKSDIIKIEKQSKAEIDKIKIEFDKQADTYQKNKQTDVAAGFIDKFMDNPKEGMDVLLQLKSLSDIFSKK